MELTGKTALVTGGSRHLGVDIARELARLGALVVVNYHASREEAERLVAELASASEAGHFAVGADVSNRSDLEHLVREVGERAASIDIVVNNAGPFSKTLFAELPEDEWDHIWGVNVKAVYMLAGFVAPGMREAGWGRIVNLSAVSAYVRNRSMYGLAKSSVEMLTEQLAVELAPEVTVNAVAPGQIRESLDEMSGIDPAWAREVTARTPAGRLVTRAEVARLVGRMCTPGFDMVTGVTIPIDGGLRLPRF